MVSLERRREIGRDSYHRRKKPTELSTHPCECGCGAFTNLAPRTSAEKGWVKDQPKRFVHGHNRRRYHETPEETRCRTCAETLPAKAFYVDRRRSNGLSSECRECRKAATAKRYEANPEHHRALNEAWKKANPERYRKAHLEGGRRRRARLKSVRYEPVDPLDIFDRDGGRCHICGKRVPFAEMTLDHLIPIARGGDHVILNVRVAHLSCNVKRGPGRTDAQLLLV